jgi:hypothetical protein
MCMFLLNLINFDRIHTLYLKAQVIGMEGAHDELWSV